MAVEARREVAWAGAVPKLEGMHAVASRGSGRASGLLEVRWFPGGYRCWVDGMWRSVWDLVDWDDGDGLVVYEREDD